MPEPRLRTALQHRPEPSGLAIGMREVGDRGMIDLRGQADDQAFLDAATSVLALALPTAPRTSASSGDITVLWLSIDQWLILCPRSMTAGLLDRLRSALAGIHSLAVDVSDMRAIIRLEGEGAREVLLKGSSLDLLGDGYPPGTVRRLLFAEVAALIHMVEPTVIDLYVFRSYGDYAWDFLLTSARSPAAIRLFGMQSPPEA
jgi:sarcosine oxidase, subunit gamma